MSSKISICCYTRDGYFSFAYSGGNGSLFYSELKAILLISRVVYALAEYKVGDTDALRTAPALTLYEGGAGLANDSVTGGTCKLAGQGGQGGGALINSGSENSRMMIDGGIGGEGGGGIIAGDGGDGGKAIIKGDVETFLSKSRLPGSNMTIHEFGAKFLSARLSGSVRFAKIVDLKEAEDFKQEHINQSEAGA